MPCWFIISMKAIITTEIVHPPKKQYRQQQKFSKYPRTVKSEHPSMYSASTSLPSNTNAPIWIMSIEMHGKFLLGRLLLSIITQSCLPNGQCSTFIKGVVHHWNTDSAKV